MVFNIAKRKKIITTFPAPQSVASVICDNAGQYGLNISLEHIEKHFEGVLGKQKNVVHLSNDEINEKIIAALSQDVCSLNGVRPIIIVTDSLVHRSKVRDDLSVIARIFRKTGIMPSLKPPIERKRDSFYLCRKRYKNAVVNNGALPFIREPFLLKESKELDRKTIRKICVRRCSAKSCSFEPGCKYIRFIKSLRDGTEKLQIYSRACYERALAAKETPLRCITIGANAAPTISSEEVRVFTYSEKIFMDYICLSMYLCGKDSMRRAEMERLTKRFRCISKLLADKMLEGKSGSPNLMIWAAELLDCTAAIKRASPFTLTRNLKWVKLHTKITDELDAAVSGDSSFVQCVKE